MSLEFLEVASGDLVARSAISSASSLRGAHLGHSGGFEVALAFEGVAHEIQVAREAVVVCDVSHARKIELQGPASALDAAQSGLRNGGNLPPNQLEGGGWWCRWHPQRAMLVADPFRSSDWQEAIGPGADTIDLTGVWASVAVVGPAARELIARLCSLDLRPGHSAVGDFHPGSIARTPGGILNEGGGHFRLFVGWALGEYIWAVLGDAAESLGGCYAGLECLASLGSEGVGDA